METPQITDGRFVLIWMTVMFALMLLPFVVIGGIMVSRTSTAASAPPTSAPGTTVATCPESVGLTGIVNDHGGEVVPGGTFNVLAGDSFFGPTCALDVPSGQAAVTFSNDGLLLHNVTVKDQGIDIDVAPGEVITVNFAVGDSPVSYFCKFHRTTGMVGALVPT